MSHALRADRLLIKPTAGARPASPCTPGRFIPKARNRGLTPDEPRATRTTTSLATAPDGPTKRHLQTPERSGNNERRARTLRRRFGGASDGSPNGTADPDASFPARRIRARTSVGE